MKKAIATAAALLLGRGTVSTQTGQAPAQSAGAAHPLGLRTESGATAHAGLGPTRTIKRGITAK